MRRVNAYAAQASQAVMMVKRSRLNLKAGDNVAVQIPMVYRGRGNVRQIDVNALERG